MTISSIRDLVLSGRATADDVLATPLPDRHRAATLRRDDVRMFDGMESRDKDPRRSIRVEEVAVPVPGPGEALVAVMASSINYNTVWSAIFEPVPTFPSLDRYAAGGGSGRGHDLPYHVIGSDLSGVVLRTGPGVTAWQAGDEVVAHCLSVELERAQGHDDTMLDPDQRIWGYETNHGGLAELALVKSNQLMPKPDHLTWEESAASGLVNSTAYRQLVSRNGGQMKLGDRVLIWGAAGGLGSYATQLALAAGAEPICVVSSPEKADVVRGLGAEHIIDRSEATGDGFRFWDGDTPNHREHRRFGARIRELTGGQDPDIVLEHPGRETFGASVYVTRKGGSIVTCASTSGYAHQYDNRYLWMNLKRIVGSHFANYREAWAANDLIRRGLITPTLSTTYPLDEVGEATLSVHRNAHMGKVGVLALAPREGLGVRDEETRSALRDRLALFRSPRHTQVGHDLSAFAANGSELASASAGAWSS